MKSVRSVLSILVLAGMLSGAGAQAANPPQKSAPAKKTPKSAPKANPPGAAQTILTPIDDAGHTRAPNLCPDLSSCIDSILANAGQFDMRNTMEAMWRMQQFPAQKRGLGQTSGEWQKRARATLEAGDLKGALDLLRAALTINPGNELLHIELGMMLLQSGDLAQAERSFQQALQLIPWRTQAWEGLALNYQAQAQDDKAAAALAVAWEWAMNKSAYKAALAGKTKQAMYAKALELINRRNEQTIAAWEKVRQDNLQAPADWRQPVLIEREGFQCNAPQYPMQALRNGEEGTVQMDFLLEQNGLVLDTRISQSSGVNDLDAAARLSLATCFGVRVPPQGLGGRILLSTRYVWKLE
ncbi:TonB family protein [Massilia sp. W12]|uniref:TonB family protein n=1 Tax=Massilia sp. W12 TaxID=3126507 RepID=UPI0030CB7F8F